MIEIEVPLPPVADLGRAEALVETCCAAEGLQATLKSTLAKHPGCLHWHYGRNGSRGTLEITLWPARRRLWLSVQAGRKGEWQEAAIIRLREAIGEVLRVADPTPGPFP